MKSTSANSNSLLLIRAAEVKQFDAFIGVAEALLTGVDPLAAGIPQTAWPLTFIAGQIVECSLKAYLAKRGVAERDLKKPGIRHDLAQLWSRAAELGLGYAQETPIWLQRLSESHDGPYIMRYPMGLNGVVFPEVATMATDLPRLVSAVRKATA